MSANMQVFLRVRPLLGKERDEPSRLEILDEHKVQLRSVAKGTNSNNNNNSNNKTPSTPISDSTSKVSTYEFSHVFDEKTSQEQVFKRSAKPMVDRMFMGESALLFAYGITNSGKTYTIQGQSQSKQQGILPRTIQAVFARFAEEQAKIQRQTPAKMSDDVLPSPSQPNNMAQPATWDFYVAATFMEIYNEKVIDLLRPHDEESKDSGHTRGCEIKMTRDRRVFVSGLTQLPVSSPVEAMRVIQQGLKRRTTAATGCNIDSSRSHSVFSLKIISFRRDNPHSSPQAQHVSSMLRRSRRSMSVDLGRQTPLSILPTAVESVRVADGDEALVGPSSRYDWQSGSAEREGRVLAKFCIVDLAGAERTGKTGNTKSRLKETVSINKSLMVLGRCLQLLRENQVAKQKWQARQARRAAGIPPTPMPTAEGKDGAGAVETPRATPRTGRVRPFRPMVIPYRDAKITRLFAEFLEGGGSICMIANAHGSARDADETIHALSYAAVASQIQVKSRVNQECPQSVFKMAALRRQREKEARARKAAQAQASNVFMTPSMNELMNGSAEMRMKPLPTPRGLSRAALRRWRELSQAFMKAQQIATAKHKELEATQEQVFSLKKDLVGAKSETANVEQMVRAELHAEMELQVQNMEERALQQKQAALRLMGKKYERQRRVWEKDFMKRFHAQQVSLEHSVESQTAESTQLRGEVARLELSAKTLTQELAASRAEAERERTQGAMRAEEVASVRAELLSAQRSHSAMLVELKRQLAQENEAHQESSRILQAAVDKERMRVETLEHQLRAAERDTESSNADWEAEKAEWDQEKEQLTADKEQLMADKQQLMADKEQLTSDKEQLTSDKEQLTADKEQLTADKEQLMAEKDQLMADKEQLTADKEQLMADKEQLMAEKDQLTSQGGDAAKQMTALTERIAQQTAEHEEAIAALQNQLDAALQAQKDSMQELSGARALLSEKTTAHESSLAEVTANLEEAQSKLDASETQREALRARVDDTQAELTQQKSEAEAALIQHRTEQAQASDELLAVRSELTAAQDQVTELTATLHAAQSSLQASQADATTSAKQVRDLAQQLEAVEGRLREQREQSNMQADQRVTALQEQLTAAEDRAKQVRGEHEAVISEMNAEHAASLEQVRGEWQATVALRDSVLQERDATISQLQTEAASSASAQESALRDMQEMVEAVEEEKSGVAARLQDKTQECERLQGELAAVSEAQQAGLAELQAKLSAAESELQLAQDKAHDAEQTHGHAVEELTAQLKEVKKSLSQARRDATVAKKAQAKAEKTLDRREKSLAALKEKVAASEEGVESVNSQLEKVQAELEQAQAALHAAKAETEELNVRVAQMVERERTAEQIVEKMESQLDTAKDRESRGEQRVEEAEEAVEAMKEQLQRVEGELESKDQEIRSKAALVDAKQEELDALKAQFAAKEEEVEAAKAQLSESAARIEGLTAEQSELQARVVALEAQDVAGGAVFEDGAVLSPVVDATPSSQDDFSPGEIAVVNGYLNSVQVGMQSVKQQVTMFGTPKRRRAPKRSRTPDSPSQISPEEAQQRTRGKKRRVSGGVEQEEGEAQSGVGESPHAVLDSPSRASDGEGAGPIRTRRSRRLAVQKQQPEVKKSTRGAAKKAQDASDEQESKPARRSRRRRKPASPEDSPEDPVLEKRRQVAGGVKSRRKRAGKKTVEEKPASPPGHNGTTGGVTDLFGLGGASVPRTPAVSRYGSVYDSFEEAVFTPVLPVALNKGINQKAEADADSTTVSKKGSQKHKAEGSMPIRGDDDENAPPRRSRRNTRSRAKFAM